MDVAESPLSTSPSPPSSFSPQRHFYLAVDRLQFKMVSENTFQYICWAWLGGALAFQWLCAAALVMSLTPSAPMSYSDLSEADRARVLEDFRQATVRWNKLGREKADEEAEKEEQQKSHVLVVTDACLPVIGSSELPVSARILINYELPTKKETYMRRMSTCLSADGIVINMVVGGEVVILKSLEESSGLIIAEMPIHIFEMM
ncbi:UNVERIFIED_CONTAM: hypothetical protein Sindi_0809700 [Sesamum indicum]